MSYGLLQRWRPETRSSIVEPRPPVEIGRGVAVPYGCPVVDSRGDRVGSVVGADGEFLTVARRWPRGPLFVPADEVGRVGPRHVSLNVARGSPAAARWPIRPRRR